MNAPFSSADYWEARYSAGGHSGAGSTGRLLAYKACFLNGFIAANAVASVIDFGCGDGMLLSRLRVETYTGIDVSETTLAACGARFPLHEFLPYSHLRHAGVAELSLSIDVIYHLIEDDLFVDYIRNLFTHAGRFVIVYASNGDLAWPAAHVRHRRFTDTVAALHPDWRLLAHCPNLHPFDSARPDDTSFADFFVFGRQGVPCVISLPG